MGTMNARTTVAPNEFEKPYLAYGKEPGMKIKCYPAALFLLLMFFTCETPAHAYIDPGTSSSIIQASIGTMLVVSYMFRNAFSCFMSGLKRIVRKCPR